MFNFTPLLGAQSASPASQSLLEFEGGIKVLIDVGWDASFDVTKLQALASHVPTLSLILLTHATPSHIAAFAHCCKHIPLFAQIPVYATQPVIYLGKTLLNDIYDSTPRACSIIPAPLLGLAERTGDSHILYQSPTKDEIALYFQNIHPLKYSQPHEPLAAPSSPPLNGLTITAYNAGHSLGGTIWHISHGMESVVYAVDWNQVRENVFNRAAWLTSGGGAEIIEQLQKPTALICSTKGIENPPLAGGRQKRDEMLLESIQSALSRGGTVLIPTDVCARVLELAYIIEHAWRRQAKQPGDHPFKGVQVYLASRTINTTLRYARSMLEWMDDSMVREADAEPTFATAQTGPGEGAANANESGPQSSRSGARQGPFEFKFVKTIEKRNHLEKILSKAEPKVIVASETSLDWGFSKDAFIRLADNPANLVILTERNGAISTESSEELAIGQTLWQWYCGRDVSDGQRIGQVELNGRELTYRSAERAELEGHELALYQQYLATRSETEGAARVDDTAALENGADVINDAASASSSESEESDSDRQGRALNYSTALNQANRGRAGGRDASGVNALLSQPSTFDYDVRGKRGRESIFPYVAKKKKSDEFGELIRPEDYLRAEERDEIDGQPAQETNQKERELGTKRKWGDVDELAAKERRQSKPSKRSKMDDTNGVSDGEEGEDSDISSEEETEVSVGPSKLIYSQHSLTVNLRLAFVDFTGLHDQRNMSLLIPLIKPRKIVLIGGNRSETEYLASECRDKLLERDSEGPNGTAIVSPGSEPLTPKNGQTVQASMDTNAWTVRLSEALVRKIQWQSVGGRDVVTLTGSLGPTFLVDDSGSELARIKRQRVIKSEESSTVNADATDSMSEDHKPAELTDLPPTLDVLSASLAAATRTVAQPLHVGDLRLADLRRMLLAEGYTAEFRGQGTLVVEGRVTVRKSAGGRLELEGGEGFVEKQDIARRRELPFVAVKKRIYDGLAVIAGQ